MQIGSTVLIAVWSRRPPGSVGTGIIARLLDSSSPGIHWYLPRLLALRPQIPCP
jgi:hypothetical protein